MIQTSKMKILETLNDFRFGFFFGIVIGVCGLYFFAMPRFIEKRALDLNIIKYNSKEENFVIKDSITLSSDDLNYLKYGSFKREFLSR
jgi:hypothetical protein